MKTSRANFDFIEKVLKNLQGFTHNHEDKDIDKKEEVIKPEYKKEEKRIVGGTDYKKYEMFENDIEKENQKKEAEDRLKMGCNNDLSRERQLYDKSTEEKLEATRMFKKEGDYFLKEKNVDKAIESYEKGLLQLFYTFEDTEEESKEVDSLKYSLNMNISQCKILKNQFKESLGYLAESNKIDKKSVKCLYRLAFVHFKLEEFEESKNYIKQGLVNANEDSQVELLLSLKSDIEAKEKFNKEQSEGLLKKIGCKVNA